MSAIAKTTCYLIAAVGCMVLAATSAWAGADKNTISDVGYQESRSATRITIRGTRTPTFMVYKLEDPDRVVVDIANAKFSQALVPNVSGKGVWKLNTWSVGQVFAHRIQSERRSVIRVVVGLARPGEYDVSAQGNNVLVTITSREPGPAAGTQQNDRRATEALEKAQRAEKEAEKARQRTASVERDLAAARLTIAEAKREVDRIRRESKMQSSRAKEQVARVREEAELAKKQATQQEKRAQAAKAEAAAIKRKHVGDVRRAARQSNSAEGQLKAATVQLNQAKKIREQALAMQAAAVRAQKQAEDWKREAQEAERLATLRQAQAQKQKKLAAEFRAKAEKEVRSDKKQSEELRRRAEKAAQRAENRRKEAEVAARTAEKKRREAERSTAAAEIRRRAALAAKDNAERKRQQAEQDRAMADKRRKAAQKTQALAEARRDSAARMAEEAEIAATRARELRRLEEQAHEKARVSRVQAEARRKETQRANQKLESLIVSASRAEKQAQARRSEASPAQRVRNQAIQAKLEKKQKRAEALLNKKIMEVEAWRAKVARLERQHEKAAKDLEVQRRAARRARAEREKEEGALASSVTPLRQRTASRTVAKRLQPPQAVHRPTKRVRRDRVRATSYPAPVVGGFGVTSAPITHQTVARLGKRQRVYRGRKIDLDFKDETIHNLLRALADVGGVNIVIPDSVKDRVTVRLRRVPWDQALEVILASKGLWYRKDGKLYRIAKRDEIDAEDRKELERIQALAGAESPEPQIFTLNYADAAQLKGQLSPLLSKKGKIEVDGRTNSLIVNDISAHRRRVIDLVSRLDTQTPQIQIEARIVEARSTYVRDIGIQWGGNAGASAAGGNATGLVFPNSAILRGGADGETNVNGVTAVPSDFAVNMPAAVGPGSGGALGLSLGSVGGNFNLNLRLSALEDQGSVRIISAPKIKVVNNVEAEISQGVAIPISVVSANGVNTQFVQADLSLRVLPHVSQRDCSISMNVEVTKNEADFANTGARGDPTILRKTARTTILVADGETSVIGGIYTRNSGLAYSKVPFLGDIPVLGWLFKKRRENDERTEVLVFITPKITNRAFLRCE